MRKFIVILFLLPIAFFGQKIADKAYYLVDSLVLEELTKSDRVLLDSCLGVYTLAKDDTSKIKALNIICDNMIHDVWSDYQFVQYNLIEESLKKNISSKERHTIQLIKGGSLNNLGLYYEFQKGNSSMALEFYLKAIELFEKLEDKNGEAMMLNRIGSVYREQNNPEKGYEYYQRSLKIYQLINEQKEISNPLNNLGLYYSIKGDYPKALDYFNESLKIDELVGNQQGIAISLSNIGKVFMSQKKYDKALISFIKGLNVFEEMGDKNGISLISTNIGEVYFIQRDYKSAYVNVKKSYDIAKESNLPNRIVASAFSLSKIYEKQHKEGKALAMFKISVAIKDSMSNENTQANMVRQQTKYEYDKQKAVDDATYDKQITIEKEAKEKQKIITYAIGLGLSLVVMFLLFVFNRLRITRKQKIIIELAHKELSEKSKEITDSITYAKRIQKAILPNDNIVKEYFKDSFVFYKPKDIVAGDFYWIESVASTSNDKEATILFAVADCTGHGVPGAMVSVVCNNALNRSVKEYGLVNPGEILNKTREIVIEEFSADNDKKESYVRDGMDIALCSLKLEDGSWKLQYAGANNPLWIIRKKNDDKKQVFNRAEVKVFQLGTSDFELYVIKANKQPIGSFRKSEPFITHSFELKKEDIIYIFSDGYVDQFGGGKGKKFMAKALRELLLSNQNKTMGEQQKILVNVFEKWKGSLEQVDDVCIMGVKVH